LLNFPLGNLKTTIICLQLTTYFFHAHIRKNPLHMSISKVLPFVQNSLLIGETVLVFNCQCVSRSEVQTKTAFRAAFSNTFLKR
ncbi:MAG: hypothetical protein V4697_04100, partial [Patescibacteria group bacterium]